MKRLLKGLAWIMVLNAVALIAGKIAAHRIERGGPEDDDFVLAAFFGGRQFHARAKPLTMATAKAVMGGIDLDLSEATCGPDGVNLGLHVVMGGINVTVPSGWTVEVDNQLTAGGIAVDTGDATNGSGRLFVTATGRMGGINLQAAKRVTAAITEDADTGDTE